MFKKTTFLTLAFLCNIVIAQEASNESFSYEQAANKFSNLIKHNLQIKVNNLKVFDKITENDFGETIVLPYTIINNKEEVVNINELVSGMVVSFDRNNGQNLCEINIFQHPISGINLMEKKQIPIDFMIFHELSHCYQKELYYSKKTENIFYNLESEVWADSLSLLLIQDENLKQQIINFRKSKNNQTNIHSTAKFLENLNLKNQSIIDEAERVTKLKF